MIHQPTKSLALHQGYNYISAVPSSGLSSGSPTLIFGRTPAFFPSHFFSLAFSSSRRKLYILDAPDGLLPFIADTIRRHVQDRELRDGAVVGGGGGGGGRERGEGGWEAQGVFGMEISMGGKSTFYLLFSSLFPTTSSSI